MQKQGNTKPRTVHRHQHEALVQARRKYLSASLSPNLQSQYPGVKTMIVIEDDSIQIVKGDRKMTEGKVLHVNTKTGKISIEGVNRTRLDGTTVQIPIRVENLMITKLNLKDNWRKKILDRKGAKKEE